MGVLVVMTVLADTAQFEAFMAANSARVEEISESAKAAGSTGHRFGLGDGQVVAVDLWDTAEHFQEFISDPKLMATMGEMGAQGAPMVTIWEASGFPGEY